jgi:hypothetical protein
MHSPGFGGTKSLKSSLNMSWLRFVEFITNGQPAWDVGVLDAHWIAMGPTHQIQEALADARRRRRGLLAKVSSWQREYLDGMLWSLDAEVQRRSRSGEDVPSSAHGASK